VNPERIRSFVETTWRESIVPALVDYIRIPAKSPLFDPEWVAHGHMEAAVALVERWCRAQPLAELAVEVVRLDGRTPLLFMEVPGEAEGTVLLYGHLDKQPEMSGWREDLGPWAPKLEGDRLYGRGGADDGYAAFSALTALAALEAEGVPRPRAVILIEACEESGSYDLPHYIEALAARIGRPDLVICLDSGCGDYEALWCTTSLRGMVGGVLSVEVLSEGVHSGDAGGIVPCTFRIARGLLSRLEDESSGEIRLPACFAEVPAERAEQARHAAERLGSAVYDKFPFVPGAGPVGDDPHGLILNRTWRPALTVTGADGLPPIASAGNVARPATALKLSLRLPPTVGAETVSGELERLLTASPPHGARVRFACEVACTGWEAPPLAPWLEQAADEASRLYFGPGAVYMGEGGSIPFMGMLGERFPDAQFFITGVLGPHSNAHGPNEFLHLPTGERVTCAVAHILARAAERS